MEGNDTRSLPNEDLKDKDLSNFAFFELPAGIFDETLKPALFPLLVSPFRNANYC